MVLVVAPDSLNCRPKQLRHIVHISKMEPLGAAASAITIGVVILEISSKLKKLIKGVRHARREIKHLAEEMGTFAKLYEYFIDDYYRARSDSEACFRSAAKSLISWAKKAIRDFKVLHHKVCALAGDPEYSLLETVAAHMKWYFSKTAVKYLRASLVVARESMIGITNIRAIQKLDEDLAWLRSAFTQEQKQEIKEKFGMPVEQYIRYLEERK
ncbi:hypothetical protein N0V83_004394 [Neocucurbitaria cava]|uniref:Uncharacterized protein n=1 Tax=Neocucurbitaria cava TaxID=798079 RepID=A0A9W8Y8G7_9PLEO|nr:hypothetical protein N0V83_004394 [Neocucurbitaria cava]